MSDAWLDDVRTRVPELPIARQLRYQQSYGLSGYDAAQLTSERAISDYFDRAVNGNAARAKGVANFISGELFRMMKAQDMSITDVKVQPDQLSELVGLVENQTINSNTAKQVLEEMFANGASAQSIIDENGLAQVSDTAALQKIVDEIIAANPQQVARYRGGDEKLFGFFVGQAMKALKGKGNPQVINQLLREQLDVKQ